MPALFYIRVYMSFYGSMKVKHIKASTEEKLELMFRDLEIAHDGMVKVINIYRGSSGVVGWYYHDFSKAGAPRKITVEPVKKTTKKKATKKRTPKKAVN